MHAAAALRPKPVREIRDRIVHEVLVRLEHHTKLLNRGLRDYWAAETRVGRTLSLIEAEFTAELVRAGVCELNLRLLTHSVKHDLDAELKRRTEGLVKARLDHESRFGVIPQA